MAHIVALTPKPRDEANVRRELYTAFDALRVAIATAGSLEEAHAIWEHLRTLTSEMMQLTDLAGDRVEQILDDFPPAVRQ